MGSMAPTMLVRDRNASIPNRWRMDGEAESSVVAVLLAIVGTAGGLGYYKYAEISAAIAAAEAFPEPREAVEAVRVRRGSGQRRPERSEPSSHCAR